MKTISEVLEHQGMKTSLIYLSHLDNKQVYEAMKKPAINKHHINP